MMPTSGDDDYDDYSAGKPEVPTPGTCPHCGSHQHKKISFNWWGGALGPGLFNLVKCLECGQQYNRKTGKAIGWLHITLYTLVMLAIFGALFYFFLS